MTTAFAAELLTIEETATLLGVERHHAAMLVKTGLIPSVRLSPRIIRVPKWLLLQKLEELATRAGEAA